MRLNWNLHDTTVRLIGALLLFVAAFHAALPADQPLTRHTGSAFSATTSDVVTNCASRIEMERPAQLLEKGKVRPPACLPRLPALAAANPANPEFTAGQPRAPPRGGPAIAPINPRAPPAV